MKKIALYGLASVFALSFAACDSYEEPNPQPQTNAQESILKTSEVAVSSLLTDKTYDLKAINDTTNQIAVAQITCTTLPSAYEFAADMVISANGFERSTPVETSIVAVEADSLYNVVVNADALQGAYYEGVSKGPKAKDIEMRFNLKTVTGNQVAYVGGPSNVYGNYKMNLLPFPSDLVIEDSYYLVGTMTEWSVADGVKFNHSDVDVYDDPVFTLKVEITPDQAAAGWWWKIVPESTKAAGDWQDADYSQFGPAENGDEALSGMLVGKKDGVEPGSGCIKEAGQWLITVNLEEGTYEFSSAVDYLYTPGDANGWAAEGSMMLYTDNYADYKGYALLSPNGFKFTSAPDWDHTNYGDGGAEGVLSNDGGAGNLTVPAYGLYWCNVNTASLVYNVTLINTIGVIGDATPAGWDASTALTTTDNVVWTGTIKLGGGEFKFRANDGWDINLGGDLQNLQQDGANIASPGEGTYEITLNLGQLPYSATLVKK